MAALNRLVKLRPVSASNDVSECGPGGWQKVVIPITGLADGAGMATDRSDNIYISDCDRHVIFKYRKGWNSSIVFAGLLDTPGNADGQGASARFNQPGPMCVDRSGVLWVIDTGNGLVRRVTENGRVFTVASIPIPAAGDVPGQIVVDDSGQLFYLDSTGT